MKKNLLPFYKYILFMISLIFLTSLCVAAIFSYYSKYQKKKLNWSLLEKINNANQEILNIKSKLKTNAFSNKNLTNNNFFQSDFEETILLNSIDFENEVKNGITNFKSQAAIKKILFSDHIFSEIEEKILYSKKTEKTIQQKQKEWILIKKILENILLFPKLKIEKFEIQEPSQDHVSNSKSLPLETLFITVVTREDYFQRLFNTIISNKYLFIISSLLISNNNPIPPLHHSLYSKEKIIPILGNENITATLRIHLFDLEQHQEIIKNSSTLSKNKFAWQYPKGASPLFTSRHYATKNEVLIDPIDYPEMLCPPIPNEWLANNNLDYSNPNILSEDLDNTGFNNLEKWQGDNPQEEPGQSSADPNDPTSHPLLWTKLRCYQNYITNEINSIYFLGIEFNNNELIFKIQPNSAIASQKSHGKNTLNKKIRYVKMGEEIEGLPYKIVDYQEKKTTYKKTFYDSSELTIENINTKEKLVLIKKTPYHTEASQTTNITSIKVENTLFNPSHILNLKLQDSFSLYYILPNTGLTDQQNIIETEKYQLINLNTQEIIIKKEKKQYKIPIKQREK